mmetsp:Transcript_14381/g.54244  ORF Transcript_14381/g.54244 Transcript_14381/m.54244 type:complete len:402 (-) Transcript_14381:2620-3825(-)
MPVDLLAPRDEMRRMPLGTSLEHRVQQEADLRAEVAVDAPPGLIEGPLRRWGAVRLVLLRTGLGQPVCVAREERRAMIHFRAAFLTGTQERMRSRQLRHLLPDAGVHLFAPAEAEAFFEGLPLLHRVALAVEKEPREKRVRVRETGVEPRRLELPHVRANLPLVVLPVDDGHAAEDADEVAGQQRVAVLFAIRGVPVTQQNHVLVGHAKQRIVNVPPHRVERLVLIRGIHAHLSLGESFPFHYQYPSLPGNRQDLRVPITEEAVAGRVRQRRAAIRKGLPVAEVREESVDRKRVGTHEVQDLRARLVRGASDLLADAGEAAVAVRGHHGAPSHPPEAELHAQGVEALGGSARRSLVPREPSPLSAASPDGPVFQHVCLPLDQRHGQGQAGVEEVDLAESGR